MSEETTAEAKATVIRVLENYARMKRNPRPAWKAIALIRKGARPMGRPRGEYKDDTTALRQMAALVEDGKAKNPHDAARQVSPSLLGEHCVPPSTIHRLCSKFRLRGDALRAEVRNRPKPRFDNIKQDVATAINKMDEDTASATSGVILQMVPELLESDAQTE